MNKNKSINNDIASILYLLKILFCLLNLLII
jgi:hypothetical protein